ncbi:hypothetical protein BM221_009721 [Beauveria bassiana]|uniref:Uncharacterized protein n=1 Tax=Beauveria bassiana TaxID=176275 RepID=A0A2N6NAP3_BEABA|nr:hypothetical protein BM221_009721 [Beauveria bassiana]
MVISYLSQVAIRLPRLGRVFKDELVNFPAKSELAHDQRISRETQRHTVNDKQATKALYIA